MNLSRRISTLERKAVPAPDRVRCIPQYEGQTRAEALAAYEAKNGPIGHGDGSNLHVFIRKFVRRLKRLEAMEPDETLGRPFLWPAGQSLSDALADAGLRLGDVAGD